MYVKIRELYQNKFIRLGYYPINAVNFLCAAIRYLCPVKRILATVILVAYMAAAIGFSFSVHYCGGSLQGVYLHAGNETGCCDDEETTDDCCEDKVVSAKSNDDHTVQVSDLVLKPVLAAILPRTLRPVYGSGIPVRPATVIALHGPAPPLIQGIPIFLLHRNLRI